MAHHDVVENNPKKEIATALIGIVLLVAIIGGIALFGWLRPAGDHYPRTADAETVGAEAAPTAVNAELPQPIRPPVKQWPSLSLKKLKLPPHQSRQVRQALPMYKPLQRILLLPQAPHQPIQQALQQTPKLNSRRQTPKQMAQLTNHHNNDASQTKAP